MEQKTKTLKLIRPSKFSAFTLIELLVVIAIVGILSGVIMMSASNATNSANDTKRKANLDSIRKALLMYQANNGGTYPIQTTLCNIGDTGASGCTSALNPALAAYFSTIPRDPNGTAYYSYISDATGSVFDISTTLPSTTTGVSYNSSTGYVSGPTDIDGNVYGTVVIGTQTWMTSNLMTSRYRDGTVITHENASGAWTSGAANDHYSYPPTTSNAETTISDVVSNKLGFLYQQGAVLDTKGICPVGWHVPTDAEFKTLVEYLGTANCDLTGTNYGWACASAGLSLREAGYVHWTNDSVPAHAGTNASGFTALGTGYRGTDGTFNSRSSSTFLWSSSPTLYRYLYYTESRVNRSTYSAAYGFSVRCLKD